MSKKKKIIIISLILLLFIASLVAGLIWLYTGNFSDTKTRIITQARLPLGLVGDQLVSAKDINSRISLAEKIEGNDPTFDKTTVVNRIVDRIIDDKKIEVISENNQVSVGSKEIDKELERIIGVTSKGDRSLFEKKLADGYGMSIDGFKSQVIKPDLLKVNLAKWYYSQPNLNKETYSKLEELNSKFSTVEFSELVKQYSQDEDSKQFGGDNGFIKISEMIPELQDKFQDKKSDDIITAPSRYGIHVIKITEVDAEDPGRIHVSQLFLKGSDLEQWLKQQIEQLKVIKLISYKK